PLERAAHIKAYEHGLPGFQLIGFARLAGREGALGDEDCKERSAEQADEEQATEGCRDSPDHRSTSLAVACPAWDCGRSSTCGRSRANLLRLHHVLKAFERQAKDRSRGYQDHAEIQRCGQQVEDREREVFEELFAALMEPGNLALEIFERSTPPGGLLWCSRHPRGSFLLGKGLSRNEGEQRGRTVPSEQKPVHAANADPPERGQR